MRGYQNFHKEVLLLYCNLNICKNFFKDFTKSLLIVSLDMAKIFKE